MGVQGLAGLGVDNNACILGICSSRTASKHKRNADQGKQMKHGGGKGGKPVD
jgi:hypothetical protein